MSQKQLEKQKLIDQIESVKDLVEKSMTGFQERICQTLDVLDEKFRGRAEEVLMHERPL